MAETRKDLVARLRAQGRRDRKDDLPIAVEVVFAEIDALKRQLVRDKVEKPRAKFHAIRKALTSASAAVTDFLLTGVTGSTLDVVGAAEYLTLYSADDATQYYLWFDVTDGANTQTDPAPGGTGLKVDVLAADTEDNVATKLDVVVAANADFKGGAVTGALAVITNADRGAVTYATKGTVTGGSVAVTVTHNFDLPTAKKGMLCLAQRCIKGAVPRIVENSICGEDLINIEFSGNPAGDHMITYAVFY